MQVGMRVGECVEWRDVGWEGECIVGGMDVVIGDRVQACE